MECADSPLSGLSTSPNKSAPLTPESPSLTDTSESMVTTTTTTTATAAKDTLPPLPASPTSPASPASPASPSLPSTSALTPRETLDALSCPVSPPLSASDWNTMEREDLQRLLSEAHGIIREKEHDLTLAAELGRNLITSNDELKKRNLDLKKQMIQRSAATAVAVRPGSSRRSPRSRRASQQLEMTSSPTGPTDPPREFRAISPIPSVGLNSPSLMLAMSGNTPLSDEEDNGLHLHGDRSGSDDSTHEPLRSPRRTQGRLLAATRHDQERMNELEQLNADLQARLEQAQSDAEHARKASARRTKKIEQELSSTRRELERAHERVSELEEELEERKMAAPSGVLTTTRRGRGRGHRSRAHGTNDDLSDSEFDSEEDGATSIKMLRGRITELEGAHAALAASKRIVNERLGYTQQELRSTKQKNAELESRVQALSHLEEEYERQTSHIQRLERALDEQRRYALGEFSPSLVPAPPPVARSPDLTAEGLRRRGKNLMDEFERGRSLMDEFEMVLFRGADANANEQATNDYSTDTPNGVDTLFQTLAGAARAGSQNEPFGAFMLDDLVGAVGQASFAADGALTKATQEDRSFFGLLKGFLTAIWRWFRFLTVLWCAVVVSVYRGPAKEITSH